MKQELLDFVKNSLNKGLPREEIQTALVQASWERREITKALDAFVDMPFPVPVPRPRVLLNSREAFIYLVLFVSLYFALFHIIGILFVMIDKALPDSTPAAEWRGLDVALRWHISVAAIMVPLVSLAFIASARRIARDPSAQESAPRRWLTYLTLFVGVVVVSFSLALLLYQYLGGELILRTVLKNIAIFLLVGVTMAYFYLDIRKGEDR